jgi:hypothetical protein
MLLVDGLLLGSALVLVKPAMMTPGGLRGRVPLVLPIVAGVIAAVAVIKPEVPNTESPNASGTVNPPPAAASTAWPDAPAKYDVTYFPKWAEWVGKPFREQKLALAIERPMPTDLEKGDWLVVFSRPDCDRCQALYREHFATPRAERVLKVSILDTVGTPLPMPCEGCVSTQLYRVRAGQGGKSPNYMLTAPTVLRLKDGIVTAVCSDVDKEDELANVLGDDGTASTATPKPAEDLAPSAPTPPAAAGWPGVPSKLEPFYIAEFGNTVGKPLADNVFARLIAGTPPADFLKGRWIIVFYREDCDHCHEMLMTYFTGKLPVRTLAIAIPDTDPASALDNPCDECVKMSLVKGPNYVIGTPVVLAIQDGVVECVVDNAEDIAALEGCLKFPTR